MSVNYFKKIKIKIVHGDGKNRNLQAADGSGVLLMETGYSNKIQKAT